MRRRHHVPSRAFALAALASMLGIAACARGKEASDSARAPGETASAEPSPAPPPAGAPLPGELAKPLAQYSPDEFLTFVHALGYGGGVDKPRKCKGAAGCDVKGGRLTSARVDAVDGQDAPSSGTVPVNGVVAVRARNTGAYPEARYGMLPNAAYEYYVVVLPGAAGTARWSMQQLVTTPGARTRTEVGTGEFFACPHTSKGSYRANFFSCSDAHLSADTVVRMPLLFQDPASDPIWIRCIAGCCTVQ